MGTPVFEVDPQTFRLEELDEAAKIIADGGLVAFPTETVYGLAAAARHPRAIHRLRELKDRGDKPFSLHVASKDDVQGLVDVVPRVAQSLMDIYWPGPLTLIFPGSAGHGIGVRLPAHEVAVELIRLSGGPIVAPSANRSGGAPAVTADHVIELFSNGEIDAIVDSGPSILRQASTVVRLDGSNEFEVLREGIITEDMMRRALASKRILFVCTGNSCRSPMAEAICRKHLAERVGCKPQELPERGFCVASAGVQAFSGGRASRNAIDLMAEREFALQHHRTRSLTRELAEEADLIVALGQSHRWQILQWEPEFASKVVLINEEGVTDPIGSDLDTYRRCAAEIETAIVEHWLDRILEL